MGFLKKHFDHKYLDEDHASQQAGPSYAPPPGPPPSHNTQEKLPAPYVDVTAEEYAPPPGPPPSSHFRAPVSKATDLDYSEPPPGPPPGYHDWQSAVPDTSLYPPPPAIANDFSPTSNASSDSAATARIWCARNPLRAPAQPLPDAERASRAGALTLMSPQQGNQNARFAVHSLQPLREGVWASSTSPQAQDLCFTTNLPLYYALGSDSSSISSSAPPVTTAYFEIRFDRAGRPDREGNLPSLAIGFAAAPYPTFRMPGWERGSFAVHSDDGRRYVNDQNGGTDFVRPFRVGEVVGLGVRYSGRRRGGLEGEAFFTRNGRLEESWSLQEETDAQDAAKYFGIDGSYDLYGAVGTFDEVAFTAIFKIDEWMYRPH